MRAMISADRLPLFQPSSTMTARCVFFTDFRIVGMSSGRKRAQIDHLRVDAFIGQRLRRFSVLPSVPPYVMRLTSLARRRTAA